VRFLRDAEPFDDVFSYTLASFEQPQCIATMPLHSSAKAGDFVVVGTAVASAEEFEPQAGRLLVFRAEPRVELITSVELKGAAYDVAALDTGGSRGLVVCVNNAVSVYGWVDGEDKPSLQLLATYDGMIVALKVRTSGSTLAVGDLMRSVSLLKFDCEKREITEVGRDYNSHWTLTLELVDAGESVVVAESSKNLVALRRRTDNGAGDAGCLETVGEMHVGETVNRFFRGSLATRDDRHQTTAQAAAPDPLIFGCVSGMLGCVVAIEDSKVAALRGLAEAMVDSLPPGHFFGGLDYRKWRAFKNGRKTSEDMFGFVDGDLVEQFLDLPPVR
jgi:DNA damage-binding protein 1